MKQRVTTHLPLLFRMMTMMFVLVLIVLSSLCQEADAFFVKQTTTQPTTTITTVTKINNVSQQPSFVLSTTSSTTTTKLSSRLSRTTTKMFMTFDTENTSPSDYDTVELLQRSKNDASYTVDENDDDTVIRDTLKQELLLLSSITNRGEYATPDEQNLLVDIVAQLEALNPTSNIVYNVDGIWDLCLSSTQFFKSSPFFQSLRAVVGNNNKDMINNAFDIHDRATTASRIGRVRQIIEFQNDSSSTTTGGSTKSNRGILTSEVDLEVGILPGFPFRVKGTVITKANMDIMSPDTYELEIISTTVKNSNIPILNQLMDTVSTSTNNNNIMELPIGQVYKTLTGSVPKIPNKTFYLDESIRITRDQDDNFFVFTRA